MYSARIFILLLLSIVCIVHKCQMAKAEKVINSTYTYETKEEAESKCIKEQWMFSCSNSKMFGLFTHEEVSEIDPKLCGSIVAEQLFYICANYDSSFFGKKEAIRECITQGENSPIIWMCKKSFS